MTEEDIAKLDELFSKATPPPWRAEHSRENQEQSVRGPAEEHHDPAGTVMFSDIGETCYDYAWSRTQANYELIAALHNAWPAIREALKERSALKAEIACTEHSMAEAWKREQESQVARPVFVMFSKHGVENVFETEDEAELWTDARDHNDGSNGPHRWVKYVPATEVLK